VQGEFHFAFSLKNNETTVCAEKMCPEETISKGEYVAMADFTEVDYASDGEKTAVSR